ncbi:hypothetical protein JXA32_08655 [Candidatus Sumerlaeota bacterium]|nr:hypothetical protein [Candidatus Sumerlaeota bacterium]
MRLLLIAILLFVVSCHSVKAPVIEIYQSAYSQEDINNLKELKDVNYQETPMDDYIAAILWSILSADVYKNEVTIRNIAPDSSYVQARIQEEDPPMTEEEYESFKKAQSTLYELLMEYRESGKDIDHFVAEVWEQRGSDLRQLVAPDKESLRSHLLLIDISDERFDIESFGSKPNQLPESREEFLSMEIDNTWFYELTSQIEQVKDAIVGDLELSLEEIARGKHYFKTDRTYHENRDSFVEGGLEGLLLELKRENLLDRWMIEKLEQDAIFHDETLRRSFSDWQRRNLPRHHEVFGPFMIEDSSRNPDGFANNQFQAVLK